MQRLPDTCEDGPLPGDEEVSLTQTASLALNDSGHYENRWATLEFDPKSPCIWTAGLERIRVPVRHGEGKFVTDDPTLMDRWAESGQLVARYVDPTNEYPSAATTSSLTQSLPIRAGGTSPGSVTRQGWFSG